jgi:hypothetical protein
MAFLLAGCLVLGACGGNGSEARPNRVVATPVDPWAYRPDPSVRELHLSATGGSCPGAGNRLDHVDVQETEAAVTITAFLHVDSPRRPLRLVWVPKNHFYGCSLSGTLIEVPVRLSQPLGTRQVLDGACKPPVPVFRENWGRCQPPPPKPEDPQLGH